jgi:hypothetical protein
VPAGNIRLHPGHVGFAVKYSHQVFGLFSLKLMPCGVAALIPDPQHQIPLCQVL